jgi:nicotinate-nucleotide pyrophosphorylase (carboxylating)
MDRLKQLVEMAIEEDLGTDGDLTSLATIPTNRLLRGTIRAKAEGTLAGLAAVEEVYKQIDSTLRIQFLVADGDRVTNGSEIAVIEGKAHSILAGERIALNFLQRLSGIATLTRRFVDAVEGTNAVILDTRKTNPAYRSLEKYAVRMGGVQNHRMALYDMLLIKDNHIDAAGSISDAVVAAQSHSKAASLFIEVEVKNEAELLEAMSMAVDRIMLDNMTVQEIRRAVQLVSGRVPLEASGNVSLETVRAIAETGVDFISVGALTHSAPVLDLSMRVVKLERV